MGDAIVAEELVKHYGAVRALDGLDLAVPEGTVLGLLGPNGAGKTTAVRIFSTLLKPDAGRALVGGLDVSARPHDVRRLIGLSGQYAAVDERLTGRENLDMVGRLYHLGRTMTRRRTAELLARFDLLDAADRQVRTYSGGMRRRLDLAAALVATPQVLFLDEPTTGLDPRSRLEMWHVIGELVRGGATLLLTTQYLEEADQLADEVAVVDHGRIIARGTSDELKARVGGETLEVVVATAEQLGPAADVLLRLGGATPVVDEHARRVAVHVVGGAAALVEAVRGLDLAGVTVLDIGLHRPSLDDVFLSLTGRTTEAEPDVQTAAVGAAR